MYNYKKALLTFCDLILDNKDISKEFKEAVHILKEGLEIK